MGHVESVAERERRAAAWARNAADNADNQEKRRQEESREASPRSNYGSVPGAELPASVYASVLIAFAWVMLASWLAFAGDADAQFVLGIAMVLGIVFFALPIIVYRVALAHSRTEREITRDFLSASIETATGPLRGSSAWLQVLLIPLALALAATLIGLTYVLVR